MNHVHVVTMSENGADASSLMILVYKLQDLNGLTKRVTIRLAAGVF